jgi:hypothetical protein
MSKARKIFSVSSVSALAQLVNFISVPVVISLYTPGAFADFAVFSSAALLLGKVATLRVEETIKFSLLKHDAFWLSVVIAFVFSLCVSFYNPLLGLTTFFVAVFSSLSMLLVDKKKYLAAGLMQLLRACVLVFLQASLNSLGDGLSWSYGISFAVVVASYFLFLRPSFMWAGKEFVCKNWKIALFRTPSVILFFGAQFFPLLIANEIFSSGMAGGFALSDKIVGAMVGVFAFGIEFVVYGEYDKKSLRTLITPVRVSFFLSSIVVSAICFLMSEFGNFSALHDGKWVDAWPIFIVYFFQLPAVVLFSLSSRIANVIECNGMAFLFTFVLLLARCLALMLGGGNVFAIKVYVIVTVACSLFFWLVVERRIRANA